MRISKQAAAVSGSVLGVLAVAGGVSAYAVTSGSGTPAPEPSPQRHVVAPAAGQTSGPVIPDFDGLPASTPATTPAPDPTSTAPTVGQSSTSVSTPTEETTVPDQPKTSSEQPETTPASTPTPKWTPPGVGQRSANPDHPPYTGGDRTGGGWPTD